MLLTLCTQLIKHGSIRTTLHRAKELSRLADRVVTLAKRQSHPANLKLSGMIKEKACFQEVHENFPQRFEGRPGGYTRIVPMGTRKGDAAQMALIGWVDSIPSRKEVENRLPL